MTKRKGDSECKKSEEKSDLITSSDPPLEQHPDSSLEDPPLTISTTANADEPSRGMGSVPVEPEYSAPKPAVPAKVKRRPRPQPRPQPKPVEPVIPKIALRVFLKIAGAKWDQLAGFNHYAKRQGLGPMTVPEWREAFQTFKTKPMI